MIGNLSKSKGFKGDKGDSFTYEDFTPEQLDNLRGKVIAILDPDNMIEKTEVIPMEVGVLDKSSGVPEEQDYAIRSIDFMPITPETTVFLTSSKPMESDYQVRVFFYDINYNFVKYVSFVLDTDFTIESEWRYLKIYRSDTTDTTVEMALVTRAIKPEFKKIYFAEHGYSMYGSIIDDETMHKLVIDSSGKDDNEYTIFEIKAPKNAPHEASLALMTKGDDITQFVDFSSMAYDLDNPTVEIVCQTRGGYKLPEFSVRYNDGKGAGRVKKFAVKPDCIPMTLTSEGIQVRRNNNYDNRATEEEFVIVNLAQLYDKVNELTTKMENMKPVRKTTINLLASAWVEEADEEYSQVVSIKDITPNSQVDLQITKEQVAIFREKDITFWAENENGVVTVCCMGQKPTNDYVIQAQITEVEVID